MGASVYKSGKSVTTGAFAHSFAVPSGMSYRLVSVGAHINTAPTSAGSITVTLDALAGSDYDTLLITDSLIGYTNWLWQPEIDLLLIGGDEIDVAYINTDNRTVSVEIVMKAV